MNKNISKDSDLLKMVKGLIFGRQTFVIYLNVLVEPNLVQKKRLINKQEDISKV